MPDMQSAFGKAGFGQSKQRSGKCQECGRPTDPKFPLCRDCSCGARWRRSTVWLSTESRADAAGKNAWCA